MKNKIIKIYLILTIIITTINIYPIYAYDWYQEETIQRLAYESDPSKDPNVWQPIIDNSSSTKYKLTIEKLLGYINVIGIVISVVVVTIIGIKYMLGSVEEKEIAGHKFYCAEMQYEVDEENTYYMKDYVYDNGDNFVCIIFQTLNNEKTGLEDMLVTE